MKKVLLFVYLSLVTAIISAQDLITKIPSNASAVFTIKGKNITDLVSTEEFESSKIGKLFLKELAKETDGQLTDLEALGLNLSQNFYYFMQVEGGSLNNYVLIPITNKEGFLSLMPAYKKEEMVIDGNITYFIDDYDNAVTMFTENTLLFVYSKPITKDDYTIDDYYGYNDVIEENDIVAEAADATGEAKEEVEILSLDTENNEEEEIVDLGDYEEEVVESIDVEEIIIETTESDNYDYYDSDYYQKLEQRRRERQAEREAKRKEAMLVVVKNAKEILKGKYAENNILKNNNYVKSIGKGKDEAVLWVDDFGGIYEEIFNGMGGISKGMLAPYQFMNFEDLYGGISLTSKLNFEDTQATIKTSYTMNDRMAEFSSAMYNGKLNKNFYNYLNEDDLQAYFSLNMSTQGILKAYPELMGSIFEGVEKEHLEDIVAISTRLVSLILDEEAIAKIIRGDMLFAMNGLEQQEVAYTTYEYDENYESTEVTKTKMETVPKFLFMITSEEEDIFNRLMRIGVKENEIIFENGIYKANTTELPFTLNMLFKDNMILFGNSTEDMMAISKGSYKSKISGKQKKLMAKNSTLIYINGKAMVSKIPQDMIPEEFKQKANYVKDNVEDVVFRVGQVKGNSLEGEMILNTPAGKGHKNSLAYFLNVIDALVE